MTFNKKGPFGDSKQISIVGSGRRFIEWRERDGLIMSKIRRKEEGIRNWEKRKM